MQVVEKKEDVHGGGDGRGLSNDSLASHVCAAVSHIAGANQIKGHPNTPVSPHGPCARTVRPVLTWSMVSMPYRSLACVRSDSGSKRVRDIAGGVLGEATSLSRRVSRPAAAPFRRVGELQA